MNNDLGYGPCLSADEYEKKIIALHSDLPPSPSREQERQTRRLELELAIDSRLGVDFPGSKRDALWKIQQKVEKKRGRLLFKYLLRKIFSKSLARDAQSLAGPTLCNSTPRYSTRKSWRAFLDKKKPVILPCL